MSRDPTTSGGTEGHWALRWLGRERVEGEYECTDFVSEVLAAQFRRRVSFPRPATRDRDRELARHIDRYAARLPTLTAPVEGDGVLMRERGRRLGLGHHIGIWCAPGGTASVLHLPGRGGAVLHPLAGLDARGYELRGIWRWI